MHTPEVPPEYLLPIKPWNRESAASLTDDEYAELLEMVERFPQFNGENDPDYKRWEQLQKKANLTPPSDPQ
jgi:hypothetical protein